MKFKVFGDDVTVSFEHHPHVTDRTPDELRRHGGTVAIIEISDGTLLVGEAKLHPNDHYSRAKGRKVALAKAMRVRGSNLGRGYRAAIWKALIEKGMKLT